MVKFIKSNLFEIVLLIIVGVICIISSFDFIKMHQADPLYPSKALTDVKRLSEYNPYLKDSNGDTDIYFFRSRNDGGRVLILGGTHPNEPAGYLAAVLILENIVPEKGTVIIVPCANNSAFTHNTPQEGHPQYFEINSKNGQRRFRFGSRFTNPIDQWPDPQVYLHYPSGQRLAGIQTRNLNRAYPGVKDGSLTERIAYGIVELIKKERIDLAFDLHEASPEYPVVNAIVTSDRGQELASEAVIELQFEEGLDFSLELSPNNYHGLSHREWTDFTQTTPVLLESANPIMGRLRGITGTTLLLSGKDKIYEKASKLGVLTVPYNSTGIPIEVRVGRHIAAVQRIIKVYSCYNPENEIEINNIPDYDSITENGIGKYLN